ncbi:MAG: 16S rRNA (guanine(966)-N(2))-methyltransferase RsmD [Mahellales bacterium]
MSLRIIAGTARGRRLKAVKGINTRPTADRVKESLFNIISPAIRDAVVLDLFAGTGNLGCEALSRGAGLVFFVDKSGLSIKTIKDNINSLGFADRARVYKMDVTTFLKSQGSKGPVYNLIFMDPPYGKELLVPTIELISEMNILSDDGMVIAEHSTMDNLPQSIGQLYIQRQKTYGTTAVTFYAKDGAL